MHRRTGRMQRQIEQPCVGFRVRAERDDAGDAELLGVLLQPCELRIVAVEHHRAAGLDAEQRFPPWHRQSPRCRQRISRCTGSTVVMTATCRPHHPHQRIDFAGVIHADLEHRKTRIRRAARQRQRHAPVIVERRARGMASALRAEHAPQRLLGRGLADRAGHRDHRRLEPRPRGMRQIDQAGEHVVHHQQRRIALRTCRAARLRPPPAPRRPSSAAATKSWPSWTSPLIAK